MKTRNPHQSSIRLLAQALNENVPSLLIIITSGWILVISGWIRVSCNGGFTPVNKDGISISKRWEAQGASYALLDNFISVEKRMVWTTLPGVAP